MSYDIFSKLKGTHAPFSPSQPSWLNYDDDKAIDIYRNKKAAVLGSQLHAWAEDTINLKIRQPRSNKTLYSYVNDAIGFKMDTEVVLYYSDFFYGTADALKFDEKHNLLRIHDLKTGKHPAKIEQLLVYAALWCLMNKRRPGDIDIELRIYQNDEILIHQPETEEVADVIDKIVHLNKLIERIEKEE